ncbi:glycosyltransferase family 2 protein [Flavobacterium sp. TMP13]|uniref:glycosyltransferase family 2 protein n=1 Tax=Flavobacterium sp. TMP13 TaxID=3425950 RepID=UPI003D76D8B3
MEEISIVIRNKNQATALEFLLSNLSVRYSGDFIEMIVLDNQSTDNSEEISTKYGAKFITIENFSYGGSANRAGIEAKGNIVIIFSAHAFPISHDFFKIIKNSFSGRMDELAGVRCLHNHNDYRAYLNKTTAEEDYNKAGLIFACSAFNRHIWLRNPFKDNILTFEDKEWTKRIVALGFKIEFVPAIFCYHIVRTRAENYFRFKNETIGSYQLHHTSVTFYKSIKFFLFSIYIQTKSYCLDIFYSCKRLLFMLKFLLNKPEKF